MNTTKSDATVIADANRLLANLAKKESSGGYTQDALRSAWHKVDSCRYAISSTSPCLTRHPRPPPPRREAQPTRQLFPPGPLA